MCALGALLALQPCANMFWVDNMEAIMLTSCHWSKFLVAPWLFENEEIGQWEFVRLLYGLVHVTKALAVPQCVFFPAAWMKSSKLSFRINLFAFTCSFVHPLHIIDLIHLDVIGLWNSPLRPTRPNAAGRAFHGLRRVVQRVTLVSP